MKKVVMGLLTIVLASSSICAEFKSLKDGQNAINALFTKPFSLGSFVGSSNVNLTSKELNNIFDQTRAFAIKSANNDKDILAPLSIITNATNNSNNSLKELAHATLSDKLVISNLEKLRSNALDLDNSKKALDKATFIMPSKRDTRTLLNTYIVSLSKFLNNISSNLRLTKSPIATVPQNYDAAVYKTLGITKDSSVYQALGLKSTATAADVTKAYRPLMQKWHPDRNTGNPIASDVYKLINSVKDCIVNGKANPQSSECRTN